MVISGQNENELDQYQAAGGNRDNKFESEGLFLALAQDFSKNRFNTAIFLQGLWY
jgi:hypothetical protein